MKIPFHKSWVCTYAICELFESKIVEYRAKYPCPKHYGSHSVFACVSVCVGVWVGVYIHMCVCVSFQWLQMLKWWVTDLKKKTLNGSQTCSVVLRLPTRSSACIGFSAALLLPRLDCFVSVYILKGEDVLKNHILKNWMKWECSTRAEQFHNIVAATALKYPVSLIFFIRCVIFDKYRNAAAHLSLAKCYIVVRSASETALVHRAG